MAKIKGQNLRIKVRGKYVAAATSCTLHVSLNLEDSSTKDSTGDFQEQEVTGKSWDGSTDALYSVDTDTTGANAEDSLDTVLAGQEVEIEFERTQGDQNREKVASSNTYGGKAYVNDISITAGNRQNATYTIQFTGNGELKKITAGE